MKAIWKGTVLAESEKTVLVEGNHYFPPDSVQKQFFEESDTNTICAWKGKASYYHVRVNGELNKDAAWVYPRTTEMANNIKGHIAFWKGIEVVK